jgi:signal transduction histidine kinase
MHHADVTDRTDRSTLRERRLLVFARAILALTLLGIVVGAVVGEVDARRTGEPFLTSSGIAYALGFVVFPIVGYVLASRRPSNALGWLMQGVGFAFGLGAFFDSYGAYAYHGGWGGPDVGAIVLAISSPLWVPVVVIPATFLILLFPDGHLPSPRWRQFARVMGIGMVVIYLAILFGPGKLDSSATANPDNPLGIQALKAVLPFLLALIVVVPVGIVASLVSLVRRYRRSSGVERLQLRWLVSASAIVAILYGLVLPLSINTDWNGTNTPGWLDAFQTVAIFSFALIPLAIGVAVLRYRLYDIDVVINRALLLGGLAIFITAVYVALVVGVGALVGSTADPVLSAVAAAIVALAFQPARRRAQRFADRLVYGKRATPYEVLSEFSERLGNAYAQDELLPRMAHVLADGTGAARADVWVRVGDELRAEATWPGDVDAAPPIAAADANAALSPTSMREPVRHQGELLGALSIVKKPGESITPTEEKLVRDLAAQAGLVMRNVALTERLMDNISQLRASRQRLVTAQDEERRKLERNIHDGAQQQLVALAVKLRLAENLTERDPQGARTMLAGLRADTGDALENLRDLARGIYPPLLADKGLVAALEAQARKAPIPTEVRSDGVARYAQDVEATVYFCTLEALNNVAKYADATRAEVRLAQSDGHLTFEVTDDGVGFDPRATGYGTGLHGMEDRVDAIGGTLEVRSAPGAGTAVRGSVPTGDQASSR